MLNNTFELRVLKKKKYLDGNYLELDIVIDKEIITLLSLYGPNSENSTFYHLSVCIIEEFGNYYYVWWC